VRYRLGWKLRADFGALLADGRIDESLSPLWAIIVPGSGRLTPQSDQKSRAVTNRLDCNGAIGIKLACLLGVDAPNGGQCNNQHS
jgi:hypothetical protein